MDRIKTEVEEQGLEETEEAVERGAVFVETVKATEEKKMMKIGGR